MARLERTEKPVDLLLRELQDGTLGLPEIQRSYVWNRPQARDLIDSLYREYPSGLILLWKPTSLPELRESALMNNSKKLPDFLVLDGQQRLTSLAKVFNGEIDVYFNVKEETFQIYSRKLQSNPSWVSVKDVLTEGAVKTWRKLKAKLGSVSPPVPEEELDGYLDKLTALEKIQDYHYPIMIIHTNDYEEITESFIRVNSKGTRLREAELAMAQLAFHWPGALVKEFESALEDYEEVNYNLEARFLMRCFVAIGTGQSRFRSLNILWRRDQTELKNIWSKTKKAVDYTINFLKNNAGIESSNWIPSINALIPLVFYFSMKKGQIKDDEVKGLLFWFFEATIHGRFTGSPESKIDQDLKALGTTTPIDSIVANLKKDVPGFDITPEMIEGKFQRNSFLPLIFAIIRKKGAQDWFTGIVLSSTNVGPEHQLEFHHIFPKAISSKDIPSL